MLDAPPAGFFPRDDHYVRFFQVDELEISYDSDYLKLTRKITIAGKKFEDIWLKPKIDLTFVCKYRQSVTTFILSLVTKLKLYKAWLTVWYLPTTKLQARESEESVLVI